MWKIISLSLFLVFSVRLVMANSDCIIAKDLLTQAQRETSSQAKSGLLEQAATLCPGPIAYYHLGRAYIKQGRAKKALAALDQARDLLDISKTPRQRWLIEGRRAEALLLQNRIAKALVSADIAVEKTQPKVPAWLYRVRRRIDEHPGRQMMSAATLKKAFLTKKSAFSAVPSVDVYIFFDTNQDQPNAQGLQQLKALGQVLVELLGQEHRALLIGHTDRQGNEGYNQALSLRRAQRVVAWLGQHYPQLARHLEARGRGESQPRYPGDSVEEYRLNRRVGVRLLK